MQEEVANEPMVIIITCSASSQRQPSTTVLKDRHQGIRDICTEYNFLVKNLLFEGGSVFLAWQLKNSSIKH